MTWWEILIIIAACAVVVGVAVSSYVRKKHGKTGCDCGCGSCRGCRGCETATSANKQEKNK